MPRILIADDSSTMRKMIRRAVLSAGFSDDDMQLVENGAEALEVIDADPPKLLVSDVNMPVMDGRTLLNILSSRGLTEQMSVVMVTSVSATRVLLELTRLGADKVVRKPFKPTELGAVLAEYLALAEPPPEPEPEPAPEGFDSGMDPELLALLAQANEAEPTDPFDEAVAQVLGDLAFVQADRVPPEVPQRSVLYTAAVEVYEPELMVLELMAERQVVEELAANLVGEPPQDDGDVLDALAELTNVLAGAWHTPETADDAGFGLPMLDVICPGKAPDDLRAYTLDGDPNSCLFVRLAELAEEEAA